MNRVVLDTNIILRIAVPEHPLHAETLAAVEQLRRDGRQIVLFPQIIYEFWTVATKTTAANGSSLKGLAMLAFAEPAIRRWLPF